jgi:hypothetical protein
MSEFEGKCELRYQECTEITCECVTMNILNFKIDIDLDKCEKKIMYRYSENMSLYKM